MNNLPARPNLPDLDPSDFSEFFASVYGYAPFPWQQRLAHQVSEAGHWPAVLDLPTGSGKTAAIDIAVFQLALDASKTERQSPLRIVYVVDRRTIVDQAHQRAVKLANALKSAKNGMMAVIKQRLASYSRASSSQQEAPLGTALLRGGIARSDMWARTPDQPLIAVSTVDQVGSRLLFRGYGVSRGMRPIHAGLLGNDVLYLLDEVHLSQPFRETLAAVGGRYRSWAEHGVSNPFVVVEMSATPGVVQSEPFRLDTEDHANAVLAQRLTAQKPTTLIETKKSSFNNVVAKVVKPFVDRPGATIAVVVNRVASAREIHQLLANKFSAIAAHLLTGRMRPLDRDKLEKQLFERIRSGRERSPDDKPVIIVATQCIEAGADFDFDVLITECASLDALRQRFGRLDRLGALKGEARGVVVAKKETFKDDPVYGHALGLTWEWLNEQLSRSAIDNDTDNTSDTDTIDFGIGGLTVPDDAEGRGLLAPKPSAPILLPRHLDAWVQTSPIPIPDPDVSLWLHGPERGVADVQVVWRADLNESLLTEFPKLDSKAKEQAQEVLVGLVQALIPSSGEAMSVPFVAVKKWLSGETASEVFDVEGVREQDAKKKKWKKERVKGEGRAAVVWRGADSAVIEAASLKPGDTIVVPASYGGISNNTWAPGSSTSVADLAEMATLKQRGRVVLRMHPEVLKRYLDENLLSKLPKPEPPNADVDDRKIVEKWLNTLSVTEKQGDIKQSIEFLCSSKSGRLRVDRLSTDIGDESGEYFIVSARRRVSFDGCDVTTEDDQASFTGVKVTLAQHLGGVRDIAGEFAHRLTLASEVAKDVQLAGRWHDVGKIDPRFQRWLHGGSEFKALVQTEPIAKSAVQISSRAMRTKARKRSGYPAGTRHELMSLALMADADTGNALCSQANDWQLVRHLVASHHGYCRPLAPWVADPSPVEMSWQLDGIEFKGSSDHHLARLDSGIADRFWILVRRYGWWGLAWLEAILRLGDHRRSEEEQQKLPGGERDE